MGEAFINFKREGVLGRIPTGITVAEAARRCGIRGLDGCGGVHECEVTIESGIHLLGPDTAAETEHFAGAERNPSRRLACEAKIIDSGEIEIMTDKKTDETVPGKDPIQAEFEALPLDQKFSNLLKMEAVTLGETFTYVVNSSMKAVEKFGDALSDFGSKIETEASRAAACGDAKPYEAPPTKAAGTKNNPSAQDSGETPEAGGI